MSVKRLSTFLLSLILVCGLGACGSSDPTTKTPVGGTTESRFAEAKADYDKGDYLASIPIFEEVRVQAPTSDLAAQATFYEAMGRFHQEMYSGAAVDFRSLRRTYPSSPLAARAQYMIGESYYQLTPRPELDQSYAALALSEYQTFLREFTTAPQSLRDSAQDRILSIRNTLAEKSYLAGDLYTKMEDPKSALVYYNRVLDLFYDTRYAASSELRIAEIQYDRGKIDDAKKALGAFEDKYLQLATEQERARAQKLRSRIPQ